MSKYLIVEMLENASGLKELRLCSVRWHGCTILYRMISMQLDAKKACYRKRDPLHHPSSSTAVGEGDYGIPCAWWPQGSPISHRSIWESLRHSESGTHLLGVHAELEITLANGHMYIHIIFKVSSTRRGQPRFHCSQGFTNKTGAATLSFQSKFHQQDGGSHAFIPAEV